MIYNLEDGRTAETSIYDSEANLELTIKAERNGDSVKVTASPTDKTFKVTLFGGKSVIMGNGVTQAVL